MIEKLLERKPVLATADNFTEDYIQKNKYAVGSENGDMIDNLMNELQIKESIEKTNAINSYRFNLEVQRIEKKHADCVKEVENSNKSDYKKNKEKKTLAREKTKAIKKANKNQDKIPKYEDNLERMKKYDMNLLGNIQNSQNQQIENEGEFLSDLADEDRIHLLNNPDLIGMLNVKKDGVNNDNYNKDIIESFKDNSTVDGMVRGSSAVIERIKRYNNKSNPNTKINPSQPYDHERFTEWKVAYNTMNLLEYRSDVKIELRKSDPEGYMLLEFTAKRFEQYKNYIDLQVANSVIPSVEKNLHGVKDLNKNLNAYREKQKNSQDIPGVSLFKADINKFKTYSEENALINIDKIENSTKKEVDTRNIYEGMKKSEIDNLLALQQEKNYAEFYDKRKAVVEAKNQKEFEARVKREYDKKYKEALREEAIEILEAEKLKDPTVDPTDEAAIAIEEARLKEIWNDCPKEEILDHIGIKKIGLFDEVTKTTWNAAVTQGLSIQKERMQEAKQQNKKYIIDEFGEKVDVNKYENLDKAIIEKVEAKIEAQKKDLINREVAIKITDIKDELKKKDQEAKDKKLLESYTTKVKEEAEASRNNPTPEDVQQKAQNLVIVENNVRQLLKKKQLVVPNSEIEQLVDIYFEDYGTKLKELKNDDSNDDSNASYVSYVSSSQADKYASEKLGKYLDDKKINDNERLTAITNDLKKQNKFKGSALDKKAKIILAEENHKKTIEYKAAKRQANLDEGQAKVDEARRKIEERNRIISEAKAKKLAEEQAKADAEARAEAIERAKIIQPIKEEARKKAIEKADNITNTRAEYIKEKRAELLKNANVDNPLILNQNLDFSERAVDKMTEEAMLKLSEEKQLPVTAEEKAQLRADIITQLYEQAETEIKAVTANNKELYTDIQTKVGLAIYHVKVNYRRDFSYAMGLKCFYEYKKATQDPKRFNKNKIYPNEVSKVIGACYRELYAIKAIETDELNEEKAIIKRLDEEKENARKENARKQKTGG